MMRQLHARKTLLYSHGNAVDLGQLQPFLRDLSEQLHVNIMSYDYSGYGRSTGMHTVNNTLADIDSVYECLQTKYRLQPKDIVLYGQSVGTGPYLYGQSVGTGPSVDLAAREADVGGLILHSPLMSGVRVLSPGLRLWPNWADVYPNLTLMPKVKCVTTILHGTEDEVIAIEHGYKLHSLCKRPWGPLWLEGYNHQNLELSPQYLPHLRSFLAQLE
uniref:Abhydrolase domain-containing protein fam108c1-like n=1 Tax=Tetraselmis sp. GSL018 TaxID=582737 RepID=A0A061QKR2_9CHLO